MKKGKAKPKGKTKEPRRRRPGSLVWRLTLKQISRMFWAFFIVNLALILMWGCMKLGEMERAASGLRGLGEEELAYYQEFHPNIAVSRGAGEASGFQLPGWLAQEWNDPLGTYRNFWYVKPQEPGARWWEGSPYYSIAAPLEQGACLTTVFDLTEDWGNLRTGALVLGCMEAILLLSGLSGTRRSVRRTLAPIQELTRMTHHITAEPPTPVMPEMELSETIDALNAINAKHLDTRISIDDEREELKGLAAAINSMLDRLDAAYQSQLRFVSDASHELRTPIAVVQGYANLLDRWGKTDPETLQESIDAIKAETQSMQALVEQLLFLARSDNNSIVMDLKVLDLAALAQEVLRDTQVIDEHHPYTADLASGLWVKGDSGLLKQALRIFVDNAIKYTPSGGQIKVSGAKENEWIRLSVTDSGIGIPEEDLPKVFDRFFRSDESRARKTGGTGLGLSIAKWTIQRHGGFLEILSRKDMGTRLTMVLPVAKPATGTMEQTLSDHGAPA